VAGDPIPTRTIGEETHTTRNLKHDHTSEPAKRYNNVKDTRVYNSTKVAKHPPDQHNQGGKASASTESGGKASASSEWRQSIRQQRGAAKHPPDED
jgi:hypothetical protein